MRFIKLLFWLIVALILVVVGFANTQSVTLTLLPPELEPYTSFNRRVGMPLYFVIFGSVIFGVLVGFIWEWLREYKHRSAEVTHRRENAALQAEVKRLKAANNEHDDDVLMLLEKSPASS
ncbi:MAG: LapA family protein [Pseudomonadota bacterium]